VLVGCVVVAFAVAWYSGAQSGPRGPQPAPGAVRLGPEPGEPVASYLARLPDELPPPGVEVPALVQLAVGTDVDTVADVLGAVAPVSVVQRVPVPRVQTALRFSPVELDVPPQTALDRAREGARRAASAEVARLTGRPAAVAAAEAAALADPSCPCVVAVVVQADRAYLLALAARPPVRAVHAAPAGTTQPEIALSPLLPDQVERADPLPDDGPLPPG